MTSPAQDLEILEVPIDALANPNLPLVLASRPFITSLKDVESQVAAVGVIADSTKAQHAANLQTRLTSAGTMLNKQRLELKRPFMDMEAKIDAAAKGPLARIETAKNTLKQALALYDQEQTRKAAEAERQRQAELARLEAIRQEEARKEQARIAELERQAAEKRRAEEEAAKKSKARVIDMEDDEPAPVPPPVPVVKTETEKQIEALTHAPAVVAQKPSGVRFKVSLNPIVEDVNKLPDMFVTKEPKIAAIRAALCAGWKDGEPLPVLAGVRFEVNRSAESTGRAGF